MTTLGIKVLTATLAGALIGGAALAAQPNDAFDLDLNAFDGGSAMQMQVADEGYVTLPLDLIHPANLVVYCNIDGTDHTVASFEICDAAGGTPVAAET